MFISMIRKRMPPIPVCLLSSKSFSRCWFIYILKMFGVRIEHLPVVHGMVCFNVSSIKHRVLGDVVLVTFDR